MALFRIPSCSWQVEHSSQLPRLCSSHLSTAATCQQRPPVNTTLLFVSPPAVSAREWLPVFGVPIHSQTQKQSSMTRVNPVATSSSWHSFLNSASDVSVLNSAHVTCPAFYCSRLIPYKLVDYPDQVIQHAGKYTWQSCVRSLVPSSDMLWLTSFLCWSNYLLLLLRWNNYLRLALFIHILSTHFLTVVAASMCYNKYWTFRNK